MSARMLPSLSLNHAPLVPSMVAIPSTVFRPGLFGRTRPVLAFTDVFDLLFDEGPGLR